MSKTVRFITYLGILSGDGKIQFITSEDGKAEPGRRAMTFERQEARDKVCELLDKGIGNTVIIVAPQRASYKKVYNPSGESVVKDDVIETLKQNGFKRWARGNVDRLYFSPDMLRYSTKDNTFALFDYDGIPRPVAAELEESTTYIDCITGIVYSNSTTAKEFVEIILKDIENKLHPDLPPQE